MRGMSKSINVSWPGVDPKALAAKAAQLGIATSGAPWSTSEFIRRAVEAYTLKGQEGVGGYPAVRSQAKDRVPSSRRVVRGAENAAVIPAPSADLVSQPEDTEASDGDSEGQGAQEAPDCEGAPHVKRVVHSRGDADVAGVVSAPRKLGVGGRMAEHPSGGEGSRQPVDTTPAGWTPREVTPDLSETERFHAVVDQGWERIRRPVTKQSQTRRKGR